MNWKIIRVPIYRYLVCRIVFNSGATCYNVVVVQLVLLERGICETYFPIRGAPPFNPHSHILCLGLIPGHFLHVYLKDGCPLPLPCAKWKNHKIGEAGHWVFAFMDRQTSCLRSRSRQKNQQINSIQFITTLPIRKNQKENSK